MTIIRITDDTTAEELAEYIGHLCANAKRQQCIVGSDQHPTAWDRAHRQMDGPLDLYNELARPSDATNA